MSLTIVEFSKLLYEKHKVAYFIEEKDTGCWECLDIKPNVRGYIQVKIRGEHLYLHRVVCELTNPTEDRDLHVLHSCDNTKCINPAHVHYGTHEDNMQDKKERGRAPGFSGVSNPNSSFTKNQILEIRESNRSDSALARLFKVHPSTIGRIRTRKCYQNIT